MNSEQLAALLRTLLQFGGGIAVGCGWLDADTAATLTGALVTLIVTVWGLYARRNTGLVAASAALPTVTAILADPAIAQAIPSPKVQPPQQGQPSSARDDEPPGPPAGLQPSTTTCAPTGTRT